MQIANFINFQVDFKQKPTRKQVKKQKFYCYLVCVLGVFSMFFDHILEAVHRKLLFSCQTY